MKGFVFNFLAFLLISACFQVSPADAYAHEAQLDTSIFIKPFSGGAPPCISCHSLSKAGIYGGTLAGDLSSSFENFGRDKKIFIEFLKNPPSLMNPVYKENSISNVEFEKLANFFEIVSSKEPKASFNFSFRFLFSAVIIFSIMFVTCYFLFNKRGR